MHQLRIDAAEIFETVAAAEEWIKNPSLTWPKINLDKVKPKLPRTRERGLNSLNPECNRIFATVEERNCHIHIAYTRPNNNVLVDESEPFACPIAPCNIRYRREGWLTRHISQCHQASEEASTLSPKPTTPSTKKKTMMPTITSEFRCPFCSKILPTKKRNVPPQLFKASIFRALNEITVGTTARSSESRLGLPGGSGPQ